MKPLVHAALTAALIAGAAAPGLAQSKAGTATPEPVTIVEDTGTIAGGIILPMLAVVIIAAVLASGD